MVKVKMGARLLKGVYLAGIWLFACGLSFVTYLQPGTHLEFIGGIDHSWAYALNYAFHNRLVMGRDLYFTFGPLGFLEHTRVVSLDMLYISSAFSLLVSIAMNVALLHLAWQATNHRGLRFLNLLAATALVIISFPEMQRLLVFGYVLIFLHWKTRNIIYLVLFSISAVFCTLIKFSYGAAALSLLSAYLALLFYQQRHIQTLVITIGSLVISYLAIWFAIYGHLAGSLGYLEGEIYISSGNSSAMAMNPENNFYAIAAFYLALAGAGWILHKKSQGQYALMPMVFVMPLLVWTKYTFSQEQQFHFVPILDYAIFVMGIFLVVAPSFWQKINTLVLMAVASFAWVGMHTADIGKPDYPNAPHVTLAKPEIMQYDFSLPVLFDIWQTAEKERLQPLVLPEEMRKIIGDAPVDVYPWELSIASINSLNFHPRPAFQIYISYLPFLDGKNRDYYNGSNAPEYIIWHHHFYQDILNRYSLSSEPLTVASILDHYRKISCKGYFCLWKRVEEPQLLPSVEIKPETYRWNEWIAVPTIQGDVLRARLFARRTLLGRLNLMAWKEGGIEIDYQLNDGSIKTHDLLIDNAVSGVWISPYIANYLGSGRHPLEITQAQAKEMLASVAPRGNMEGIDRTSTAYKIRGWMGGDNINEESYILLTNAKQAYLFHVDRIARPDVADYFASKGQSVNVMCGIDQEIDLGQVAEGAYQVRLVLKSGSNWSALPDQHFTLQVDSASMNNKVKQFRIRTTRPWAFDESVQLQWQPLTFRDGPPWF